jgi:single-stranded-DNA-specific exonuclease
MQKKWNIKYDCRGLETGEIIDTILMDRGVENVTALLYPTDECLVPFEEMKNIGRAAKIILDGIENNKKFLIYYDTDQDGVASGTIAFRWLKKNGANVSWVINKGKEHGIAKANFSVFENVDILWIVDSIETQMYPYENALNIGVENIIISDHHLCSKSMQKQMERTGRITLVSSAVDYPNPDAAGAVVTWKLCAYMDWLNLEDYSDDLIDLAAVGCIADMTSVSVDSLENRYICHKGFSNEVNPAIKKINGSYEFNSQAVSFGIATLTNAANRTNENEKAVELFLEDDPKKINVLVNELKSCKEYQNFEIADIMPVLEEQAKSQMDKKCMFFFVETENEVAGLTANKLLEKYSRPVFVLKNRITVNEETGEVEKIEYTGSCRAVGVKNFKEYVDKTSLVGCAGHELAFGVWMDSEVLEDFQNALEDALKDVQFIQETTVDIQISQDQITDDLIRQLKMLNRISGQGWPQISVMVSDINNYAVGQMSGGKHLKLIADEGKLLYIKWNFSGDCEQFDGPVSAIGTLDSGFFGRNYYRQLIMNDFIVDNSEDL